MEMAMLKNLRWIVPVMRVRAVAAPAAADVITDWNEKAVAFVTARGMLPPPAERTVATMHVAMFDAVNSIERRYRPYAVQLNAAKDVSPEAAAATAAARVLAALHPNASDEFNALLTAYLAPLPPPAANAPRTNLA